MVDLKKLVRPNIQTLKPYHSARDDFKDGLLLDANENSQGAPHESLSGLNRYPSPQQITLREKFGALRQLAKENVFVGAGSDEAIDLLFCIFCRPGRDRIIITPPTYGMYNVSANIHDIGVDEVLLNDEFQPSADAILQQANASTKLLFLCSPNNPTGNLLNPAAVQQLIKNFAGIVVIDEAYIDFSGAPSYASKVNKYKNLVVLQTMSKSFGLAGIRMGVAFASEAIIRYFMKVKAPYNVNTLTSRAALQAFRHYDHVREHVECIKKEREWLREELSKLSLVRHIHHSDANFLLVKMKGAKTIYRELAKRNIIVRYRGNEPECSDCLRITVGTRQENKTLINALKLLGNETLD